MSWNNPGSQWYIRRPADGWEDVVDYNYGGLEYIFPQAGFYYVRLGMSYCEGGEFEFNYDTMEWATTPRIHRVYCTKELVVLPPQLPPIASYTWQPLSASGVPVASDPRTGDRIEFDASASSDSDGEILEYAWDWDSNDTYDSETTDPVIEHTFTASGSHQVTLRVTDDAGATATITKTVSIGAKQSPNSAFTFTPSSPSLLDTIQFTDSSSDPDGAITSWHWNFGDGSSSTSRNPSHRFSEKGPFTVQLTVTDNEGLTDSETKTVTLKNILPTATFAWQALSSSGTRLLVEPRTGDSIQFDASASSDSDGEIVKYAWDWEANGSYNETTTDPVIEHTFSSSGSHQVTLRVTDDAGATATVTKTIAIGAKQPPNAASTFTPSSPSILDTIQFADSSSDPDGSISSWTWNFGDGSMSTSRNPSHRFTDKGTFTVQLTVTDNDGLTDSTTQTVTIRNLLPEARFSVQPSTPLPHQPVSFDASLSSDADGEILSYNWDFDGDGVIDSEEVSSTWTFAESGDYVVTLVVEDDDQAVASTTINVAVGEAPTGVPLFDNLYAVVIGVGVYEDSGIRNSTLMSADAQAVYNFLVDRDQGGFPVDHVRLLLDEQATQRNIESAFTWLMDMAQSDDLVVVYFAGHGSYERDRNGDEPEGDTLDEFLLPYDTDPSDLFVSAIRDDDVGDWIASMSDAQVVMILDSCYAGGASRSRGYDQPTLRAGPGNTVFSDFSDSGLLVLAACQENETSKEDPALGHGVFTYHLLLGLGGLVGADDAAADVDQDGRVTIEELQTYLEEEVPLYVRDVMRETPQNPMITGDEALVHTALSGYGIPLIGEVITVQDDQVLISLGSRHGVQAGDRFEVVYIHTVPDGSTIEEVRGVVEVVYVLAADRVACRVVDIFHPIEQGDQVRPVQE